MQLAFSAVHLRSGVTDRGPMIYWLVVAAVGLLLMLPDRGFA